MPNPVLSHDLPAEFWTLVVRLLDADRWPDARVTVHAVARQRGRWGCRLTLGVLLYERGLRHEAVQEWTAVLEQALAEGEWSLASAAHHNLAAMYRDIGDHRLARSFQQRALSLSGDCGPEDLLQLGNDALAMGRHELAESLFQTAADLVDEDDRLLVDLVATRGLVCGLKGDLRQGLRWLRRAYVQHLRAHDHRLAGRDLVNAAALLEQLGRRAWAMRCLTRAVEHFTAANDAASRRVTQIGIERLKRLRRLAAFDPSWN